MKGEIELDKVRIKVLDTKTTRDDELVKTLIGTIWDLDKYVEGGVVIDVYGGLRLEEGEYEIIDYR